VTLCFQCAVYKLIYLLTYLFKYFVSVCKQQRPWHWSYVYSERRKERDKV